MGTILSTWVVYFFLSLMICLRQRLISRRPALIKPLSDSHSSFLAGSLLICGCKPQMLRRSLMSRRGIVAASRRRWFIASVVDHDLDALDLFLCPCHSLPLHTQVSPKDLPAAAWDDIFSDDL
ncbi:hypothetical protein SY1_02030 [Fretibacterium fastidiosum]|uniref:Secreted protein n=1 Tax=Fretibacterium fastidiosum TaxID=651822 RepID=A0AB94IVF9_9BACT|nr:hypothetical protein SY1_02030 [Fretibacterium fastidiosum]